MTMTSIEAFPVIGAVDAEIVRLLVAAGVMIVITIFKTISGRREQVERAKAAKAGKSQVAATPKRDNRFRNEIEVFLEEVGRRRGAAEGPQRPANPSAPSVSPPQRGAAQRDAPPRPATERELSQRDAAQRGASQRESARPSVAPAVRPRPAVAPKSSADSVTAPHQRPGAAMAARKSPVSDDLGQQVRAHLAQYLDSARLSQQVQADIGNAVERAVRSHLGQTLTHGTEERETPTDGPPPAAQIVGMLRNPRGLRDAILINEILGRPKGLGRKA